MLNDTIVFENQRNQEILTLVFDVFTAKDIDPKLYKEVKQICMDFAQRTNRKNNETWLKLGHLSKEDFLYYIGHSGKTGNGIGTAVVERALALLVSKYILMQDDFFGLQKVYYPNTNYLQYLHRNRLVTNLLFGYRSIIPRYRSSVFKIIHHTKEGDQHIGTGFLLGVTVENEIKQIIITNKHVVENAESVEVLDAENKPITFGEPELSENEDLALIPLPVKLDCTTFLFNLDIVVMEEIITMGYPSVPRTKDSYQVCHRGEINSEIEDYYGHSLFLFSSKTSSGNSGSPILDPLGRVVGIVTEELFDPNEFMKKGKLPYYAGIPSKVIVEFLSEKLKVQFS